MALEMVVVVSVLVGIILGLRFKVMILVPAITLATLLAVTVGVALATTIRRLYGERFDVDKMANLLRKQSVLDAIREDRPADWSSDEATFAGRRANYLLYN